MNAPAANRIGECPGSTGEIPQVIDLRRPFAHFALTQPQCEPAG